MALLESLSKCYRQLGQDLGTCATYVPTETDSLRKLYRTVLLLLLRSDLLQVHELDAYLKYDQTINYKLLLHAEEEEEETVVVVCA